MVLIVKFKILSPWVLIIVDFKVLRAGFSDLLQLSRKTVHSFRHILKKAGPSIFSFLFHFSVKSVDSYGYWKT